jgi:hypothetical protein
MNKKTVPWVITTVAILVIAFLITPSTNAGAAHVHPEPRLNDPNLAATVMAPASASNYQRAVRAYRIAQVIPEVLDGMHCYCECHENIAHRSLLTCFHDGHGAACDVCIGEAEMAATMHQQGDNLEAIRAAVDAEFGARVM